MITVSVDCLQIVQFHDESNRTEFVCAVREMLKSHDKSLLLHNSRTKDMLERATTKQKRQENLAKFFRSVFAEVNFTRFYQYLVTVEYTYGLNHCSIAIKIG